MVFKAKNNGHQNLTLSKGISDPPPYLGNIPKKTFFYCFTKFKAQLEKGADGADTSLLFFRLAVLSFWPV